MAGQCFLSLLDKKSQELTPEETKELALDASDKGTAFNTVCKIVQSDNTSPLVESIRGVGKSPDMCTVNFAEKAIIQQ